MLADPIDAAVARAFERTRADKRHAAIKDSSPGADVLARAMQAEADQVAPLAIEIAQTIYSFDQEAIEQPWGALSRNGRGVYYDIAEAVLRVIRKAA